MQNTSNRIKKTNKKNANENNFRVGSLYRERVVMISKSFVAIKFEFNKESFSRGFFHSIFLLFVIFNISEKLEVLSKSLTVIF